MNDIQRTKLEYLFTILDSNGNQILQPDDFTTVAERISDNLGHEMLSTARLELKVKSYRLFVQVLADIGKQDVSINLGEWLAFFKYFEHTNPEFIRRYISRVVNYIFSLFDQNNDLFISRNEYADMFRIYGLDEDYMDIGFSKLDENGDQFISKEELRNGFYDFFLSSDPEAAGNWIFGNWRSKVEQELI